MSAQGLGFEDFFRGTFEKRMMIKMPESDDDHLTPATRLLEKRKEMQEVQSALAAQKEEFQMKSESLQQRREELERKEFQLRESLLKFDKFLKENDSKRARADKKAFDERSLKEQKIREIYRLKEELETVQRAKNKQRVVLDKHVVYQQYMDSVLEITEEFGEIRELVARHDTLAATNEDLKERQRQNLEQLEGYRVALVKFTEEKNNDILNYNNQLANLQTKLEKEIERAMKWDSHWNSIMSKAAKKTLLLGQIKMATHNLFNLVNKHLQMRLDHQNTVPQLEKIQEFIQDLSEITSQVEHSAGGQGGGSSGATAGGHTS